MPVLRHFRRPIRGALKTANRLLKSPARKSCAWLYNGERISEYAEIMGEVPVILIAPPMFGKEGALIQPGVRILQNVLRKHRIGCEVLDYNLPVVAPEDPFDHLLQVITTLRVRILGVSLYSQCIQNTMRGLRRVKQASPETVIVLGGPHSTEAHRSLLGLSFVDFVVRGEAEESFPKLVTAILSGKQGEAQSIPGVYSYDHQARSCRGQPAEYVELATLDRHELMPYRFDYDELRHFRHYRGLHGLTGPRYWPLALVRGCPYACTYCAAYQMSGKKLRFRDVDSVIDEIAFYVSKYDQRHFSIIDDAFTESFEYVESFCRELLTRELGVFWTTDNGIRYETLGSGRRLQRSLIDQDREISSLLQLMIRSGWRGTSIGVESGSPRVRRELVRKGGTHLSNEEIKRDLRTLKQIAEQQGVYFYINAFLMTGFPELVLPNGKVVPAETVEERLQTYEFAMQLRKENAIDFMNLSIVIPLPATDMWDHLEIRQRMDILLAGFAEDHPYRATLQAVRTKVERQCDPRWEQTRYSSEAESLFWQEIYDLPDEVQIEMQGAYDQFNAYASHNINMLRPQGQDLWKLRQRTFDDFYSGLHDVVKLFRHVFDKTENWRDFLTYVTYLDSMYYPEPNS